MEAGRLECCPLPQDGSNVAAVGGRFTWRLPAVGPQTMSSYGFATLSSLEVTGATATTGGAPANRGVRLASPFALTFQLSPGAGTYQSTAFAGIGVTGREVSRVFVPEPPRAPLLAMALAPVADAGVLLHGRRLAQRR